MSERIIIREACEKDFEALMEVEKAAFGRIDEAELVRHLLADDSAKPLLSLIALVEDKLVGHILFTKASLKNATRQVSASLLAPLAVVPEAQGQGTGSQLVKEGIRRLAINGIELVFVLGHPGYYTRLGFKPAGRLGFDAPYPIPEQDADAWMVQSLKANVFGTVQGQVVCANALDKKEYWEE